MVDVQRLEECCGGVWLSAFLEGSEQVSWLDLSRFLPAGQGHGTRYHGPKS